MTRRRRQEAGRGVAAMPVVVVEHRSDTFIAKYSGTSQGDTIKGKTTFDWNGQTQTAQWDAKRIDSK
jgi:hypothetical protein